MKMKMNKHIGSLVAILAGVAFFLPTHTLAAAFGVSPPWIENENLKPGSSFVYIINLSSNELSDDMVVNAKVTGDKEVSDWLSVPDSGNLVMTKGQVQVPMKVGLSVPANAKLGKYTGTLSLSLAPRSSGEGNVAVLLGANISVKLNVINHNVTDYWVQSITAQNVREDQDIRLNVRVKNDGNTEILNVPVKVEVLDGNTQKKVGEGSADRLMTPVLPHTLAEVQMDVPVTKLAPGNYWVKATAMDGKKVMYENKLYVTIESLGLNNVLKTEVLVGQPGMVGLRPAAVNQNSAVVPTSIVVPPPMAQGRNVQLQTTVTVRAPLTNQLVLIVIGLLLVIVGFSYRIYTTLNKKEHHAHHNRK
jgi:hypothetical protein